MPTDLRSLERRAGDALKRLAPPDATCLVAVSGGPDSLALLDLLHRSAARHGCLLVVGHVDHGIDPGSATVADQVAAAAAARGLPFRAVRLALGAGASETRARVARRAALLELADAANAKVIVLGHHADDQAETVLLRLVQGSGPAGLAGMASRRGRWVRPLLGIRRATLAAHLASHGLEAWSDPANGDRRHLRSWLRHDILPALEARLPEVAGRLNRSASQAADLRGAWREVLDLLPGLDLQHSTRGISVAAPILQGYRSALRHAVLAGLGRRISVLLGVRHLAAVDRLLDGRSGATIALAGGCRAELAFGRLTFYRGDDAVVGAVELIRDGAVRIGRAKFAVADERAGEATRAGWTTALVPGKYAARTWLPGDRIRPLGGTGSRAVAVLLREAHVAPARRRSWPVVLTGDDATIVWVPGICRADVAVPAAGDEAWRVDCAFT